MDKKLRFSIAELASRINGKVLNNAGQMSVEAVVNNSRLCKEKSLFVAIRGSVVDGHRYIDDAFENGAAAVVVSDRSKLGSRPGILVENGYRALSRLSSLFNGEAAKKIQTIGITGTNGKTTIHWILYHVLRSMNLNTIRIGSLGVYSDSGIDLDGKAATSTGGEIFMTTPGPLEIHRAMGMALQKGISHCVMETSSHAMDQYRVADLLYHAAIFTNLTPDHLNYHNDMEAYFRAKVRLFEQMAENRRQLKLDERADNSGGAVINTDDSYGRRLIDISAGLGLPVLTFGEAEHADIRIVEFVPDLGRSVLKLKYNNRLYHIRTPLIGDYNASNIAAVFTVCISLGLSPDQIVAGIEGVDSVPERLESVGNNKIGVYVDYAHTGVGLRSVLSAVRKFVKNDLWVVFGCGGGKDPGKRAAMGKAAASLADRIVLTNDNPRKEDPKKIIDEILASGCQPDLIELDRGEAIHKTLKAAQPGDVVILAGKGHEDYQIIDDRSFYFSDKETVLSMKKNGLF